MSQETQASQHKPYTQGYNHVNHHEWRTAENSAAYFLPVLKEKLAKQQHVRLLDIGCGSGTITASLAKHIRDSNNSKQDSKIRSEIVAVDLSDTILAKTRAFASQAGVADLVTTHRGSVFDLERDFGEQSFDLVHTSMMLVHVDEPVEALRQMMRVCKKDGGVVAAREADMRMMATYPASAALHKMHELNLAMHAHGGGSPDAGVRLLSWALSAGARREQVSISMGTWCYSTLDERRMWAGSHVARLSQGPQRKVLIEVGGVSESELDQVIRDWKDWAEAEDGVHASMHGELLIRL